MQQESSEVHIRHFQSATDAIQVSQIWINGFKQTVSSKKWPTQPLWRLVFNHMAKQEIQDKKNVGPNGKNLFKYWCEDK